MICEKCGSVLEGDITYCPECVRRANRTSPKVYFIIFAFCIGVIVFSWLIPVPARMPIEELQRAFDDIPQELLETYSDTPLRMPLFFMSPFLFGVAPYIAALATVISAKINYPKDTAIAALFWIFIAITILIVILFVIAIVACFVACNACANEMRSCR